MHIWIYVKTQSALNSLNMIFCAGSLSGIYVLTGGKLFKFLYKLFHNSGFFGAGSGWVRYLPAGGGIIC